MRSQVCLMAIALVAACFIAGCDKDSGLKPDPNAGKSMAQRQAEDIKAIEDNPNMPDSAKQMAISAIKGHGHPGKK